MTSDRPIDMRAPKIRRLKMSRPRLSSPSQCCASGSAHASPTGVAWPNGAMSGASSATSRLSDDDGQADLRGDGDFIAEYAHGVPSDGDAIKRPQRGWRKRGLDRMARMSAVMLSRMNVAAKIRPQA